MLTKQNLVVWLSIAVLSTLMILLLSNSWINWDVLSFIHEAEALLAGGSYSKDFFETNSPLIIYLSIPLHLMIKYLHLPFQVVIYSYFLLCVWVSLFLCYQLLPKIFDSNYEAKIFFILLAAILLLVPITDFGQREHLFLVFSMPYLLLASSRLRQQSINKYLAISIGLIAAIGWHIKPYFIILPLMVEAYLCVVSRNLTYWYRPEIITTVIFSLSYLAVVFYINPDYVSTILPYALRLYYEGYGASLLTFMLYPGVVFAGLTFFLDAYVNEVNGCKQLSNILIVSLIATIIIFIMEGVIKWYYHFLPVFMLTLLLNGFYLSLIVSQQRILKSSLKLSLLLAVYFLFALYVLNKLWFYIILAPTLFFGFFAVIFAGLLYVAKRSLFVSIALSGFIVAFGFLFSNFLDVSQWASDHKFILTILILVSLFVVSLPKTVSKSEYIGLSALFILTLAFPLSLICSHYSLISKTKQDIVGFLRNYQQQPVYIATTFPFHDLVHYSQIKNASRFPLFWMLPGLENKALIASTPEQLSQLRADKDFFMKMVIEDIQTKQPVLILVDVSNRKNNLANADFSYLRYFAEDENFRKIWLNYSYLTSIGSAELKFDVYKRS